MNNKKIISIIALIMVVLMLVSLVVSVIPTSAYADEDYDQTMEQLRQAKEAISAQIGNVTEKLQKLNEEKATVIEQKMALEERNTCALQELALIGREIELYQKMIDQKGLEVEAAKDREAAQLEKYRGRVRSMEENGGYNILDLILKAESLSDLLAAIDDYEDVMESDRKLSDQYEAAREETEAVMAEYEEYKAEIEEKKAVLTEEQKKLEEEITESEEIIEELSKAIEETEEEKRKAEEAEDAAAASIAAFIAEYQRRRAEEVHGSQYTDSGNGEQSQESGEYSGEEQSGGTGSESSGGGWDEPAPQQETPSYNPMGTGSFAWPVPSSYRVSSTFKERWGKQHTGIDIDGFGLDGNPIVASDGGKVILASYYGGYGNCVMIDHGNDYVTVYAHLSGFAVSNEAYVSQGQTIGYLGSTGNSTGTHCHFEIRLRGTAIDPLPYFGGYELEPGAAD